MSRNTQCVARKLVVERIFNKNSTLLVLIFSLLNVPKFKRDLWKFADKIANVQAKSWRQNSLINSTDPLYYNTVCTVSLQTLEFQSGKLVLFLWQQTFPRILFNLFCIQLYEWRNLIKRMYSSILKYVFRAFVQTNHIFLYIITYKLDLYNLYIIILNCDNWIINYLISIFNWIVEPVGNRRITLLTFKILQFF